jgi:hypothetical protein
MHQMLGCKEERGGNPSVDYSSDKLLTQTKSHSFYPHRASHLTIIEDQYRTKSEAHPEIIIKKERNRSVKKMKNRGKKTKTPE